MDATRSSTKRTPDEDAVLAELYLEHAPRLTRWMTAYTRDPELAQDVVQEAFLRLAKELAAGRRPDNAPAWLALVARNLATSRARRNATALRFENRLDRPSAPVNPASAALAAERGDGWLPQGTLKKDMPAAIERLHERRDAAGRDGEFTIGAIAPFLYVGDAGWDTGKGCLAGDPERIAGYLRDYATMDASWSLFRNANIR